jgi:hypothetical protein
MKYNGENNHSVYVSKVKYYQQSKRVLHGYFTAKIGLLEVKFRVYNKFDGNKRVNNVYMCGISSDFPNITFYDKISSLGHTPKSHAIISAKRFIKVIIKHGIMPFMLKTNDLLIS